MLKNAINWFEIPVTDYDRAISFYEFMLDQKLTRETMDGIDMAVFPADDKAVPGALVKADFLTPGQQGSLVYLNVDGFIDQAISRASEKGAEVLFPKTDIGENGFYAHISDCEGNKIGLHSWKP